MKKNLLTLLLITTTTLYTNHLKAQNALSFDGADDFIQTNYAGVTGSGARTIEAWVRTTADALPTADGQQVIADYGTFINGSRFTFCVLWANAIRLEVGGNGLSGTIPINDSLWHHVAVVYNPALTNKLSLYVDGVLDVSGNVTLSVNTGTVNKLRIGQRIDGVNNFTGDIDEVRFWNTALDSTQLRANMSKEMCTYPTGLAAYFKLNEGFANGTNTTVTTTANEIGATQATLSGFALTGNSSNWILGAPLTSGGNTYDTLSVTDCKSFLSPSGKYTYTATGTYVDTIPNVQSCDSIITINLTLVKNPTFANLTIDTCGSYTVPSGKKTFNTTTSQTYLDTIPNSQNCDSIIAINLTVTIISGGVNTSGNNRLTATEAGARYQWLDCNNGFAILTNDTNRFYDPIVSGSYAVQIIKNGCIDTTACVPVVGVGLNQNSTLLKELTISPNPTNGQLTINFGAAQGTKYYFIRNFMGQIVSQGATIQSQISMTLEVENGIYFIQVQSLDGEKVIRKVVKH